jgi:phage shock protein PspC (stress-responsive transcriptional regulator)/two-component sensor histidine kinase
MTTDTPPQASVDPSSSPPPPPPPPPPTRRRPRLLRTRDDRVVAGVAGGLARHIGVDPTIVRIGFVVLSFAGGVGVLAYGALWAATDVAAGDSPTVGRRPTVQQAVALGLITLGVLLLLRRVGLWFGDALVWPIVIGAAGSAIVWTRGDDTPRREVADGRFGYLPGRTARVARAIAGPVSPVRIVVGTVLVGLAVAGFLAGNDALFALRQLGLAVLAALAGAVLLFGPWVGRVVDELGRERRERVRQEERAELAAHLHDSVLQTLALIQRSSDDPRRIATLARVQERELRAWLYGTGRVAGSAPVTLTDAVEAVAAEVEALHHLAVDVVVVGDAPVDDRVVALLGAVREAVTNAAKHAQVDEVAVYVEVTSSNGRGGGGGGGSGEVTAYVRDRGVGFDPAVAARSVDGDHRRGLRDSVLGRVERHGGRAHIWSAPGEGTEIEVAVPLGAAPGASTPSSASSPPAPEESS